MANHQVEVGDTLCDKRSHADHGETSDAEVVADRTLGSNRSAGANPRRECFFVRFRGPRLFEVRSRGTGKPVVGEDCPGADHDSVFDGYRGTDVDERIDLDQVNKPPATSDIGLLVEKELC